MSSIKSVTMFQVGKAVDNCETAAQRLCLVCFLLSDNDNVLDNPVFELQETQMIRILHRYMCVAVYGHNTRRKERKQNCYGQLWTFHTQDQANVKFSLGCQNHLREM